MIRCRVGVVLLVVVAATVGSRAQSSPVNRSATVPTGSSGTLPVSPSVLAGYTFSTGDAGLAKLDALVLWRGQPSWRRTSGYRFGGGGFLPSGNGDSLWTTTATYGSFQLAASSNASTLSLVVQGRTFDLRRANVILVDAVDAPSGPVIVDTFRIEAQVPSITGVEVLLPVFNATPELRTFLRCGLSGPNRVIWMEPDLCSRMTP